MRPIHRQFSSLALLIFLAGSAGAQEREAITAEPDPLAQRASAPPKAALAAPKAEAEPRPDLPPGDGDFVRYLDGAERQLLQTGVVRYIKGDRIVDLVGAVHLADPGYFDALNTQLEQYDAVLYEMVGGEFQTRDLSQADPEIAQVQMAHGLLNKVLGMEYQTEGIDYDRLNFIHADIDWTQYGELMASRNQSLATLFERAMAVAQGGDAPALLTDEEATNSMFNKLISGLTTGNTADLKRAMAPFLGEAETFITKIEGDDGTVLVTERNKVVMSILNRTLDSGMSNVAIFYGAGHLPDLEKRLIESGYRKDRGVWLTAWEITDPAPGEGTNLWKALLSDPETIQSLIGNVQEMLRQLQEGGEAP
jgi:hypothetical protein